MGWGFPLAIALLWIGSLAVYAVTQGDAGTAANAPRRAAPTRTQPLHPRILAALAMNPAHPRKRPPGAARSTPRPATATPIARIGMDRLRAAVEDLSHPVPTKSGAVVHNPRQRGQPRIHAAIHPTKASNAPPHPSASPGPTHRLRVWVTGYDLYGTTATGLAAGPGICAVDPYTIPLGTHITIAGVGDCVAADTGPTVVGAHVDVWVPDYQTALNLTGWYTATW